MPERFLQLLSLKLWRLRSWNQLHIWKQSQLQLCRVNYHADNRSKSLPYIIGCKEIRIEYKFDPPQIDNFMGKHFYYNKKVDFFFFFINGEYLVIKKIKSVFI